MRERLKGVPPVLLLALAAAVVVFIWRALGRAGDDCWDFYDPYLQARAWALGLNPYDWESIAGLLSADLRVPPPRFLLYPPPALALISPFTLLPWGLARVAWIAASAGCYFAMVHVVGRRHGLSHRPRRMALYLTGAIAMYGVHAGIRLGQPSVIAGALTVLSIELESGGKRRRAAGILAGLAICLKPSVGAIAFGFWVVRWRRVALAHAAGTAAVVTAVSLVPLLAGSHPWFAMMFENQLKMLNFRGDSTFDTTMVDLNSILRYARLESAQRLLIRVAVVSTLTAMWLWVFRAGRRCREDDPAAIRPILCLALLAVYHRTYDLIVLIPVFAWLVATCRRNSLPWTLPALIAIAPMMQPVPTTVVARFALFTTDDTNPEIGPFGALAMSHVSWLLLFLCAFLIVSPPLRRRAERADAESRVRRGTEGA